MKIFSGACRHYWKDEKWRKEILLLHLPAFGLLLNHTAGIIIRYSIKNYIKTIEAKAQEMIVLSAIFFTLWQFCSHQFPALTLLKGRLDWIAEMCHHYQTKCSIARCTGPLSGAPCWTKKARNLAQIRCRISSMKNHHWKSWILKSRSWDSRHIPNSNDKDNWGQKYLNLHCMIICNAIRCSHDQCLIYKTYWPI